MISVDPASGVALLLVTIVRLVVRIFSHFSELASVPHSEAVSVLTDGSLPPHSESDAGTDHVSGVPATVGVNGAIVSLNWLMSEPVLTPPLPVSTAHPKLYPLLASL